MENDIYRGDIFYIDYGQYTGSEQRAGRPGVVVSNDMNNTHSATVEVVYLTTQPKENLPTHVTIRSTGKVSTVLCEQITTVSKERIGKYIASCSENEMIAIETAMMVSLQLTYPETFCQPAPGEMAEPEKEPDAVQPPPGGREQEERRSILCGVYRSFSRSCRARHLQRAVRTAVHAAYRG